MQAGGINFAVLFGVLALWMIVIGAVVAAVVLLVRYMRKRARVQDELLAELRKQNDQ